MYCTYLTAYRGNKLPPFYIGYARYSKLQDGYRGSVCSKQWKDIWNQELKDHPELFKTTILTYHETKTAASDREVRFQNALKVLSKPELYINKAIGRHTVRISRRGSKNRKPYKRTFTTRVYGPVSEETKRKQSLVKMGKKHSEETKAKMRASHLARLTK